jgi:hypothetical protein
MKLKMGQKVVAIVLIVVVVCVSLWDCLWALNDHSYIITVRDKERIAKGENSYYLIFAEDSDGNLYEFRIEDIIWRGFFKSSSLYNQFEVGKTYEINVVGYRVGFLSEYENILKADELAEE